MNDANELQRILDIAKLAKPLAEIDGAAVYDIQQYGAIQGKRLIDAKLSGGMNNNDPFIEGDPNAAEFNAAGNLKRLGRNTPIAINPDILYNNKYRLLENNRLQIIFDPIAVDGITNNNLTLSQVFTYILRPTKEGWKLERSEYITGNDAMSITGKLNTNAAAIIYAECSGKVATGAGDELPDIDFDDTDEPEVETKKPTAKRGRKPKIEPIVHARQSQKNDAKNGDDLPVEKINDLKG